MKQTPSVPFSVWKEYMVSTLEKNHSLTISVDALTDLIFRDSELVDHYPAAVARAENSPDVRALREQSSE
jgi:hypothetical protein